MILDKSLELDPPLSAITVTRRSINNIGSPAAADLAIGTPIRILCACDVDFTAAGAATLQLALQGAPDNGSGAPGAWTTYAETDMLAVAVLKAGRKLIGFDLPRKAPGVDFANLPAWYSINYTVATGPMLTGSVFAYLDLGNEEFISYPAGFTVG